ncbi:MAG: hypothetical protein WCX31_17605 [Salinivirgaceae bacterium]
MNSNSGLVKTIIILALINGIVGFGMAISPFKMLALIPSLVAILLSLVAYFIAKAKQGKLLMVYVSLLIAVIASGTAVIREYAIKDKVVVDQKFEEKKEQSVQEVEDTDELDELQDDLE